MPSQHGEPLASTEQTNPSEGRDDLTLPSGPTPPVCAWNQARQFGDYELLTEIARGGMGVVYRARQISLHRVVALKMIIAGQLASKEEVARFRREAEAAANLDHPNIVPIYEVGENEGNHYFSMKLIEGGNLAHRMTSDAGPGANKNEQRAAAALLATIARAVHHAHQRGILHRDLKPANILMDKEGQPYVTDFGVARRVGGQSSSTQTGHLVGTPSYMSPEQARSEKVLTTAVDVYSLGAILYELLTGRQPFRAETPLDTVLQVLDQEPVPPRQIGPQINADLETICLKCLEKDPVNRYGSAEALADDLDRWRAGEPITARPVTRPERLWRWSRRNPIIAASAAAAIVALVLGTTISTHFALRASAEARLARRDELKLLRNLYLSQMNQAWLSWQAGEIGVAQQILEGQEPDRTGGRDMRGFEWDFLSRLARSSQRTLWQPKLPPEIGPHLTDGWQRVAFRPGTSQMAWVNWPPDGGGVAEVILADTATGERKRTFSNLSGVQFSPDGKWLAGCSAESNAEPNQISSIAVWNADTGMKVATVPGQRACAFSPDGGRLFLLSGAPSESGRSGDLICIWDWAAGKKLATLIGDGSTIRCFVISPNGKLLATGSVAGSSDISGTPQPAAKLWDADTGKELGTIQHNGVKAMAFSRDGRFLATVDVRGGVRVWNVAQQKQFLELPRHSENDRVSSVLFTFDNKQLITASNDHQIRVWDLITGDVVRVFRGHDAPIISMAANSHNELIATMALDGSVRLWQATEDQESSVHVLPKMPVEALAFGPGPDQISILASDGLHATNIENGRFFSERSLNQQATHLQSDRPHMMDKLSADGRRRVVVMFPDKKEDPVLISVTYGPGHLKPAPITIGHAGSSPGLVSISQDGHWLALGGSVNELWDLDAERLASRFLEEKTIRISAFAFSADGKLLALAESYFKGKAGNYAQGVGFRIVLMDTTSGKTVATLPDAGELPLTLAFTPDSNQVLAAGERRIYQWDINSSQQLHDVALTVPASAPAFSPDCRRLATGGRDGQGILWDVATGQRLLTLAGLRPKVDSLTFSPDGTRLAATGMDGIDGVVKLWDATPQVVEK